jgi:hypothetical protein
MRGRQRRRPDTVSMKRDPALDDAIETATDRTRTAQGDVEDTIEAEEAPRPAAADRVVRRAEDLHDLTAQAVDDEGSGPPTPEPPPDERPKRHAR